MAYEISQVHFGPLRSPIPVQDLDGYRLPVKVDVDTLTVDVTAAIGDAAVTNTEEITATTKELAPILLAVLAELRTISALLAEGLNIPYDPATIREDPESSSY